MSFISEKNIKPFMARERKKVEQILCIHTPLIQAIASLIVQYDITLSDKYKLGKIAKHKKRIKQCLQRKKERKCLYFNRYTPTIPVARIILSLSEDAMYWQGVDDKKTGMLTALAVEISGADDQPFNFWISPKVYEEIKACRQKILNIDRPLDANSSDPI